MTEHPRTGNNCLRAVRERGFVYLPTGQRQHRHQPRTLPSLPSTSALSSSARGRRRQLVLCYLILGPTSEDARWADRWVPALMSFPWARAPIPRHATGTGRSFHRRDGRTTRSWRQGYSNGLSSPMHHDGPDTFTDPGGLKARVDFKLQAFWCYLKALT